MSLDMMHEDTELKSGVSVCFFMPKVSWHLYLKDFRQWVGIWNLKDRHCRVVSREDQELVTGSASGNSGSGH